jgi:type VI secretion system Hcp family effector
MLSIRFAGHLARFTLAALASSWCLSSQAEDMSYGRITASKQGVLQGEIRQKGREFTTLVRLLQTGLEKPRDASGNIAGRSQFRPLIISHSATSTMAVQLVQAASTNEVLQEVKIQVWTPSQAQRGTETNTLTIRLINAFVVSINYNTVATTPGASPAVSPSELMQDVGFSYQRMEITDPVSNVTTVIEPLAPNA